MISSWFSIHSPTMNISTREYRDHYQIYDLLNQVDFLITGK